LKKVGSRTVEPLVLYDCVSPRPKWGGGKAGGKEFVEAAKGFE